MVEYMVHFEHSEYELYPIATCKLMVRKKKTSQCLLSEYNVKHDIKDRSSSQEIWNQSICKFTFDFYFLLSSVNF